MQTGRFLSANGSPGRASARRRRANRSGKCFEVTYRGDLKEKSPRVFTPSSDSAACKTPPKSQGARRRGVGLLLIYQAGKGGNSAEFDLSDSSCVLPSSPKHLLSAYCVPPKPCFISLWFSSILNSPLCFQTHRDLPYNLGDCQ